MSFSQLRYKSIDDTVNKFFKELVAKYNINEKDLVSIWNTELISPQAMDVLNTQMGSTSISDAINNPKSKYYNLFNHEIQCRYIGHLYLLNKYSFLVYILQDVIHYFLIIQACF